MLSTGETLSAGSVIGSSQLRGDGILIVNGELIEADADKFIHDRLTANAVITPCKP